MCVQTVSELNIFRILFAHIIYMRKYVLTLIHVCMVADTHTFICSHIDINTHTCTYTLCLIFDFTSSTAQGGGGSFKHRTL